jgi:hypothetical protein
MNTSQTNPADSDWLKIVRQHIEPLNYGSVEITIHNSQVVQINKIERLRFPKNESAQRSQVLKASAA